MNGIWSLLEPTRLAHQVAGTLRIDVQLGLSP